MPDPIDLTRMMTAAEAAAYLATNPDAVNRGLAPLSYWIEKCNVGSAGARSWPVDTSGKVPTADSQVATANGLLTTIDADTGNLGNILTENQNVKYNLTSIQHEQFGAPAAMTSASSTKYVKRIAPLAIALDGAGAGNGTVVAALASYTGCARLLGVWSPTADAATTFTFAITAGTLVGPTVFGLALVANAVTNFSGSGGWGLPISGTISTDNNKAMTVAVAGGPASVSIYLLYEQWYEY